MFPYQELELLLDSSQICFDVIAITETRILKSKFQVTDINLKNYGYEYCPTESSSRDTLLYIGNHVSRKSRNDLRIYKTAESESTCIELINTKTSNVIIGAIYKNYTMDLDEFNDIYLDPLLDKTSKESKPIFLLGDFNVDLLKCGVPTNEFLEFFLNFSFFSYVITTHYTTN